MVKETILVMGGCRSGKSSYALELAVQISGDKKLFVATCIPYDDEKKDRVAKHKKERDKKWLTIETPIEIYNTIKEKSITMDVILIDCLTLWISNLMGKNLDDQEIFTEIQKLILSCKEASCSVIIVSNEVGAGIVPENSIARRFRDIVGFANQKVASSTNKVTWMVAGIPVPIKG